MSSAGRLALDGSSIHDFRPLLINPLGYSRTGWPQTKCFVCFPSDTCLLDSAEGVPPDRAGDAFWYPLWGGGHRCPRVWSVLSGYNRTLVSGYFRDVGTPKTRYEDGPRPMPPRLTTSISPAFRNRSIDLRTVRSSAPTSVAICFSEILAIPFGFVSRKRTNHTP